jgi:hypothetical protein
MKAWKLSAALALTCLAVWTCASTARAMLIMPQPGPARVVNSDAVIVGRVVALEPQDVKVDNAAYRIAIVKVAQSLHGAKDAKTLRIGFIPPPMNPGKPGGPIIRRPGFRGVQLQVGNDGLFLLKKHAKGDFYTLGGPAGYFINSENNKTFDKEVQAVKTVTKLLDNPRAGLKAKDGDERLLAAAILIEKYRTFRGPGKAKEEPIDAAESKLIMHALADAEWQAPTNLGAMRPNPQQLFGRLGVTPNDGWRPQPGANFQVAAQNWVREHADSYRIRRYVNETK